MDPKVPQDFPLKTLLEFSHARLDDAARQLGQLLASEQASAQKLELLLRYREEYRQRFMQAAQSGIPPDLWQNYQRFLGRLEEAIGQQEAALRQSKQRTMDGQKAWLKQRTRTKAFDTLSERHRAQEQRTEAKREQRLSDEHAINTYQRNQE